MNIYIYCDAACRLRYSAWHNCSRAVQREGCTFYDLFTQVLQYPRWSQFNSYNVTQQRYTEAVDYLQHLCNNIQPGNVLCKMVKCNADDWTGKHDSLCYFAY